MATQPWVTLVEDVPKTLHLRGHLFPARVIRDPETGRIKQVQPLTFIVDREDGVEVAKEWSILSTKLAAEFLPFLENQEYQRWNWVITQSGKGYLKSWLVTKTPFVG